MLAICIVTAPALADPGDPQFETPRAKAGEVWMTAMLAPGGAVAAPSKDKPLDYVAANRTKSCKAMKSGTAKDVKAVLKLKTCVVDSYKAAAGKESIKGQWAEYPADGIAAVASAFPASFAKQIQAQAKGSTVVEGHYSGNGLNFDAYLAMDADNHVHAIWITEEAFE